MTFKKGRLKSVGLLDEQGAKKAENAQSCYRGQDWNEMTPHGKIHLGSGETGRV